MNVEQTLAYGWQELPGKVDRMVEQLKGKSPHKTMDGVYDDMRWDWWTSGFWPGILWIMHEMTGKDNYLQEALPWDERLEQCFVRDNNLHHDVGFQFLPTAVIKYKLTGDQAARRRGLAAANFLAGRFNIKGNFLRAWNQEKLGWSIIDSSMNLSLLFWAAEEIGDPRFRHIAMAHADTVLKHFIREDGSVCHIVSFNPETGEFIESLGGQGYGPNSAWSRGQAWALHGMANAYRFTKEERYLQAARRVAHYFLAFLPEDLVPYWDYRADNLEGEPRDTSAASCAASGLLEIADFLTGPDADMYRNAAKRITASLTEKYATWNQPEEEGILREGTGNKPGNQNIDVSLIYGDYYYVETLAKLNGWKNRIF